MEQFLNWIKLPKTVAWPIVFVTGLLLWGPENFNKGLGLDLFIDKYRIWVGVAFLFFLATGLTPFFPWAFNFIKQKITNHQLTKENIKKIDKLTTEEKNILRSYIDIDIKTQNLNIQDGVVSRLLKIGFLYLGFEVSYGGRMGSYTFPVNINDWLWDYLRENPSKLE